tara:strand:+ start:942 stop:2207 length:1266 start_codon:yes stop_codon:yes gene_type:complete
MYFWYKLLTYILQLIAPFYLFVRKLRKKEHPQRYKEKLSLTNLKRENGFLVWFHVASVGEAMSIISLIEGLEKDNKVNKILITTITLSSSEVLKKKFVDSKKVVHQFLPLDITKFVEKFLNHWSPNLSIFIDSEIWPILIFEIKKRNIPLLLINGRLTKKSYSRWKIVKNFSKKIFEKFDLCIASNKETEKYLLSLGAKNIKNYGNLKFANPKSKKRLDDMYLHKIKNRKIWCAASTHPSEEIFCANVHKEIKETLDNILTIIIPRHVDRIQKIKKDLSKLDLKVILYSNFEEVNNDTDIILVDSYGETSKFYNISKSVFIGKSLSESIILDSGQNPIEASRFGCKIFHGPNVANFLEIYNFLGTLGASKQINTVKELSELLVSEFKNESIKNVKIIEKIENYGNQILDNVNKELKDYINT